MILGIIRRVVNSSNLGNSNVNRVYISINIVIVILLNSINISKW